MPTDEFNPYHEWLGFSKDVRDPDHFVLLRVRKNLEEEREVLRLIEVGFDRIVNQLSRIPPGVRVKEQQAIRQRVNLARETLADPESRAAYLSELLQSVAGQPPKKPKRGPRKKAAEPKGNGAAPPSESASTPIRKRASDADLMPPGPAQKHQETKSSRGPAVASSDAVDNFREPLGTALPSAEIPMAKPIAAKAHDEDVFDLTADLPPVASAVPVAEPATTSHDRQAHPTGNSTGHSVVSNQPSGVDSIGASSVPVVSSSSKTRRSKSSKAARAADILVKAIVLGVMIVGAFLLYQNFDSLMKLFDEPSAEGIGQVVSGDSEEPGQSIVQPPVDPNRPTPVDQGTQDSGAEALAGPDTNPKPPLADPDESTAVRPVDPANDGVVESNAGMSDDPDVAQIGRPEEAGETTEGEAPATVMKAPELTSVELERVRLLLDRCQRNLARREFQLAAAQLSQASKVILDKGRDPAKLAGAGLLALNKLRALEGVKRHLIVFWQQVADSARSIQGNKAIPVNRQVLGFVEAGDQFVVLRNAGSNVTYQYRYMGPAMAVAMGDAGDIPNNALWAQAKAAFYLISLETADSSTFQQLLNEAKLGGADCTSIENLAELIDTEIVAPAEKLTDREASDNEFIQRIRSRYPYRKPSDVRLDRAESLVASLFDESYDGPHQAAQLFSEIYQFALLTGRVDEMHDAVIEWGRVEEIDAARLLLDGYMAILKCKLDADDSQKFLERSCRFLYEQQKLRQQFSAPSTGASDAESTVSRGKLERLRSALLRRADNGTDVSRRLLQMNF